MRMIKSRNIKCVGQVTQEGAKSVGVLVGISENKGLIGRCQDNIKSGIM
jgi:hypothetical protein